jgi:hypothetical protein
VQLHNKLPKEKFQIIAISDEPAGKVQPYVEKNQLPFAIGYGSKSNKAYGVRGIPHAVLIDPNGNVAWDGHPADKGLDERIDQLVASAKGAAAPGKANPANRALGDALAAALKESPLPKDVEIVYTKIEPKKDTPRELSIKGDLNYVLSIEGQTDPKKGKLEDKDLQKLLQICGDIGFATKEIKEPAKPSFSITLRVGGESRTLTQDPSKPFAGPGKLEEALEGLIKKLTK